MSAGFAQRGLGRSAMHERTLDQLLEDATSWAEAQADVVGLALVGSHARGGARDDSDVDLVLLSNDPTRYFADTQWIARFGVVERQHVEHWGKVTSIRVWYAGGLEVEFGIATPDWAALPIDDGTQRVVAGGFKVLLDRSGALSALVRAAERG